MHVFHACICAFDLVWFSVGDNFDQIKVTELLCMKVSLAELYTMKDI